MNASGPKAPFSRACETCPNKSSIKVVREAVVGLSGVMVRSKYLQRGYSYAGTHVAERRPSGLRSSHSMRILDSQSLVVRMSCCAVSDGLPEREKGGLVFDQCP